MKKVLDKEERLSQANEVILSAYEKGYRINESGGVLSHFGKNLKLSYASNGYLVFGVKFHGVTKVVYVHRFAAYQKYGRELFEAECVRHLDSDRGNNTLRNIALGSLSDNYGDNPKEWKKDFARKGAATRRKLSVGQVKEIKSLIGKKSVSSIAREFGVSATSIVQIREGKSYKWVI